MGLMNSCVRKLVNLRLWEDEGGRRWARSAKDLDLEMLCVSQFTLYHVMKGGHTFHENIYVTNCVLLAPYDKPHLRCKSMIL